MTEKALTANLTSVETRELTILLLAVNVFYVWSLSFGYFFDDLWILQQSVQEAHPLHLARPWWHLSTVAFAQISVDPFFQRLISLLVFNGIAVAGYVLLKDQPYRLLIMAVLLSHPWFIYPVTWISQRADLWWILFVILALMAQSSSRVVLWTGLSLISKAPFLLHALVFSGDQWRKKRKTHALIIVVMFIAIVIASYLLSNPYHGNETFNTAQGGTHQLSREADNSLIRLILVATTGGAKIIESIALMLVPFPAVYKTGIIGYAVVFIYLFTWIAAFWYLIKTRARDVNWMWILIGLFASSAFFWLAQLRAIVPGGFFLIGGLLLGLKHWRIAKPILVSLVAVNLITSIYLYDATNTGCFDLYEEGAAHRCVASDDLPYRQWMLERNDIVKEIVSNLKTLI
jgi:hypothetical protein